MVLLLVESVFYLPIARKNMNFNICIVFLVLSRDYASYFFFLAEWWKTPMLCEAVKLREFVKGSQ